jgi:hypothetical protein
MMTLKLWHALRRPPATHPIFRRTVLLPGNHKRRYISWAGVTITLVLGLSDFMPTLLLMFIPLVLLLSGIVYGVECAVRVSHAIASEHENSTYTLLALCPPGALAVSWVICTSAVYRNREFERLTEIVRTSVTTALIGIGVMFGLVWLVTSAAPAPYNNGTITLNLLLNAGVIFAVMYWEFIQSVLLGCMVGLLIPTYTISGLDAGLYAPGIFLLLKMTVYALSALLGLSILPDIYSRLRLEGSFTDMSLALMRAFIFIGIQESVIRILWDHLLKRVNASSDDVKWALFHTQ